MEQVVSDLRNQAAAAVNAIKAKKAYVSITGAQHWPVVGEVKSKWNFLPAGHPAILPTNPIGPLMIY